MSHSTLFPNIEKILQNQLEEQILFTSKKKELFTVISKSLHTKRVLNKFLPNSIVSKFTIPSLILGIVPFLPQILTGMLLIFSFVSIVSIIVKIDVVNYQEMQIYETKENIHKMIRKAKCNDALSTIVLLSHLACHPTEIKILENLINQVQNKQLLNSSLEEISTLVQQEIKSLSPDKMPDKIKELFPFSSPEELSSIILIPQKEKSLQFVI